MMVLIITSITAVVVFVLVMLQIRAIVLAEKHLSQLVKMAAQQTHYLRRLSKSGEKNISQKH